MMVLFSFMVASASMLWAYGRYTEDKRQRMRRMESKVFFVLSVGAFITGIILAL